MSGYMCMAHRYKYNDVVIEYSGACGFFPINKNGDMYTRCPSRVSKTFNEFMLLSNDEKKKYHLGGGCVQI